MAKNFFLQHEHVQVRGVDSTKCCTKYVSRGASRSKIASVIKLDLYTSRATTANW